MAQRRVRSRLTANELLIKIGNFTKARHTENFTSPQIAFAIGLDLRYTSKKLSSMRKASLIRVQETTGRPLRFGYFRGIQNIYAISAHGRERIAFLRRQHSQGVIERYIAEPRTRSQVRDLAELNLIQSLALEKVKQELVRLKRASDEKTKLIERCQGIMGQLSSLLTHLPVEDKLPVFKVCLLIQEKKDELTKSLSEIERELKR